LDSEEIGVFTVGCAGGTDTTIVYRAPRAPADGPVFELAVTGLMGGHSGTDIHKNRGNSLKVLFRLLLAAVEDPTVGPLRIGAVNGGSKRNAIPREARGRIGVESGREAALRRAIERQSEVVQRQLASIDEGLRVAIEEVKADAAATSDAHALMSADDSLRFLQMMNALPHGVQGMDVNIPDLVETSCNVGVLDDLGGGYQISVSGRSSLAPALRGLLGQIRSVARLAGAEATHSDGYPGWKPNLKSPLLARSLEVHRRVHGREATVRAIHAGLECGLLTEKYPDLDIISYGPDIQGAHSPDERVRIETVARMWTFTRALIEDLAR
jgi:dipeptidase D